MGRISIFGTRDCSHCTRAKGSLTMRGIPFTDIDLDRNPDRRADMMNLTDRFSIPQVFFNSTYIGGADELTQLLENDWDRAQSNEKCTSVEPQGAALDRYRLEVASQADPLDPRLRLPATAADEDREPAARGETLRIQLPDGTMSSAVETMLLLDGILDNKDRLYKAHKYKQCFVNHDGVNDIMNYFGCTRAQAIAFLRRLQTEHAMLHHVCEEHEFRDDGPYLFFRLQPYHQPGVLNSFRVWSGINQNPASKVNYAPAIVLRLKDMLGKILQTHTDPATGLMDYIAARNDPRYPYFEEATCELQVIDMALMDEASRKAFALNLYNLMISYAFIKMGVGTSTMSRAAFFSFIKMNIGGQLLSFSDVENGILRSNTRHPYSTKPPFGPNDPRRNVLALSSLDCRIHFALNCGAKSCPPVKFFHAESLDEELRVAALSFCETDDAVLLEEAKQEVKLSMLFKWFQSDFVGSPSDGASSTTRTSSKDRLLHCLLQFVKGTKREMLERMLQKQEQQRDHLISIKFLPYDWTVPNISRYEVYSKQKHSRANMLSVEALWNLPSHSFRTCNNSASPREAVV